MFTAKFRKPDHTLIARVEFSLDCRAEFDLFLIAAESFGFMVELTEYCEGRLGREGFFFPSEFQEIEMVLCS